MYRPIKRFLVGNPISTAMAHHERLNNKTALAVFSSDALSSVAYSTEAILVVLVAEAGAGANGYLVPIVFGIVVLLAILTLSYRQTIKAYPSGGGAYIVAKDNLGTPPGLVAGASLLVDYILTVAVSISAGVAAITSAVNGTHFEFLQQHRVVLCLLMIAFIAVVNLRGVRESGALFAGPTYLFILGMLVPVSGIHRGVIPALEYARNICGDAGSGCVNAVYVEVNPAVTPELRREWERWGMGIPLEVVESPFRSITTPLLDYIRGEARRQDGGMTTVVLPEFVPARWWQHLLHNQTSFLIKAKPLFNPRVIVTSVPYHLRR
jgi:hypothetical protein